MFKFIGRNAAFSASIKINRTIRIGRVLSGTVFAALLLATLIPYADNTPETNAANGISNPATSTITVDVERSAANLGIMPGTFNATTDDEAVVFSVTTDNFSGYVVTSEVADNGILANTDGDASHILSTISTDMTSTAFNNPTNNNKWGIKPSKYYDLANSQAVANTDNNALFFPTDATLYIDKTSAANSNANSYTVGLGARVDTLAQSGLYSGTMNVYVVGNPMSHTITYNKNTTSSVTNMPQADVIYGTLEYATLSSVSPSRSGYTFLGWCAMQPGNRYGVDYCGGTVYQPGDEFGLDYTSNANDTLYAMWQSGAKTYIQDVTPETCPIVPTVVFDYRDEAAYVIMKMLDGNCWMLENLRLGDSENAITLTPEYTNIESDYILPASTSENFGSYTTGQINTDSKNKTAYSGEIGEGKTGVYYNYCAASAGTYCTSESNVTMDVTSDICPKGWHLPTGAYDGEYRSLYTQYDNDILFADGFRAPYSGYYIQSGVGELGNQGAFWASTTVDGDTFALLMQRSSNIPIDGLAMRLVGASIRCIKEIPKRYMQDVAEWKDDLGINESTLATDRRDNKVYWVTKLETDPSIPDDRADCTGTGSERVCTQLWMTQNLDLDLDSTKTYTHADTDLGWTDNDENVVWVPESTLTDQNTYTNSNTRDQSYTGSGRYYYTSGTTRDDTSLTLAGCIARGHTEYDCRHYQIGNFYNYYAATALGATSGGSQVPVSNNSYTVAPNSVCPAGWKLPTGYAEDGTNSDLDYLLYHNGITSTYGTQGTGNEYTENGFNNMRVEPLWVVRAGAIAAAGVYNHYRNVYYWSNTIINNSRAQLGVVGSPSGITFGSSANRYSGYAVRCVAREENPHIYIQDVTTDTCPTIPTIVYDKRDEEAYTIRKLDDGNCWLLDNLHLDLSTTRNLTTTDTNITADWTAPADIATWANSYDIPKMNADYKDTTGTGGYTSGKYGAYYNYCAATAGTYCYEEGAGNGNATQDICPKGWRMPTGGASGEYQALYVAYNSDYSSFVKALRTPLSGYYWYYNNSYAKGQGEYGEFWSSTDIIVDDYDFKYYLDLLQTNVYFEDVEDHGVGASVRCIAKNGTEPEPEKTYIQDVTIDTCPTEPTVVYDNRDEEAYTIQKLEDGNCWLLDNLRLDLTDADVQTNLTADTTNASNATLAYLKNGGGTTSDQYAVSSVSIWDDEYDSKYASPLINTDSKNTIANGEYGGYQGKIGIYYNFCAASAGSYCYGDDEEEDDDEIRAGTTTGNATEDICPKGWHMPSGGPSSRYQALSVAYNRDDASITNALHLPNSGSYGGYGYGNYFWSSSRSSNYQMYGLYFGQDMLTGVSEQGSIEAEEPTLHREYGYSIRCVANGDEDPEPIAYLQDITASTCPSVPTKAIDSRDGEIYVVQKKADGNCWMLDNLRLGSTTTTTTLTSENTNIAPNSTYTLPVSDMDFESYTDAHIYAGDKNKEMAYYSYDNIYGKVGTYYNYCAATAGTYCLEDDYNTPDGSDPIYDICPAGWRLPTGGDVGEYWKLFRDEAVYGVEYSSLETALHPYHTGTVRDYEGGIDRQDEYSAYWSSTIYRPSPQYEIGAGTAHALILFGDAYYADAENRNDGLTIRCIAPAEKTYIQDVTTATCPTTPTIVYDRRDDEPYYIQKLNDGKCWLLENLRLESTALKTTLTSENTNIAPNTTFTLPAPITENFGSYTTPQYYLDDYSTKYNDLEYVGNDYNSTHDGIGLEGIHYNYCAATAGTYCSDSSSGSGNAEYDICPAGWRLPTGGENGEYKNLYSLIDEESTFGDTLRIVLPGSFYGDSFSNFHNRAYFWTSTGYEAGNVRTVTLQNSNVYPADYHNRDYGFNIRCVAK